jgi:hypothetical protein
MIAFFLFMRAARAAYKGLRAMVGILVVIHGTVRWAKNKRKLATA